MRWTTEMRTQCIALWANDPEKMQTYGGPRCKEIALALGWQADKAKEGQLCVKNFIAICKKFAEAQKIESATGAGEKDGVSLEEQIRKVCPMYESLKPMLGSRTEVLHTARSSSSRVASEYNDDVSLSEAARPSNVAPLGPAINDTESTANDPDINVAPAPGVAIEDIAPGSKSTNEKDQKAPKPKNSNVMAEVKEVLVDAIKVSTAETNKWRAEELALKREQFAFEKRKYEESAAADAAKRLRGD